MPVPAQPASRTAVRSASRSLVRSGSRSRAGAARRSTSASVLDLQGLAGNGAVSQLLGGGAGSTAMLAGGSVVHEAALGAALAVGPLAGDARAGLQRDAAVATPAGGEVGAPAGAPPDAHRSPADLDVGFNPTDRSHRLIIAIDQKEVRGDFTDPRSLRRHVDFAATQGALAGLTADQVRQVDDAYSADPDGGEGKRRLADDIFGGGGSGYRSDLDGDQLGWLRSLLGGTRAVSADDDEAAAAHQREADAYELHGLLFGDLEGPDIERVMAILRRSAGANEELIATYDRLHVTQLRADLVKLPATELVRASMLLAGSQVAADAMKMAALKGRLAGIDERLATLTNVDRVEAIELAVSGGDVVRRYQIDQLNKERRSVVDEIVERAGRAALEGRAQGTGPMGTGAPIPGAEDADRADPTGAAGDLGAQSNVAAVVGDVHALATQMGGASGEALRAIATADPGRRAAAELRKLSERGELKAEAITATLRGLREEAHAEAQRRAPGASAADIASQEETLAKQYVDDLRADWNAAAGADGPSFDALLGTGSDTDADLNTSLAAGHGRLADVRELVLALQGDRKDLETVKRVLADKSADEINVLRMQYFAATGGRFLDVDLFGAAPTEAGGENPQLPTGDFLLPQGKATGSDRLTLEDYLQRPRVEGGLEEVLYLSGRAEREYEYTIANRGATGWWRDQWGNEARRLLDETITTARQISAEYEVKAGWIPDMGGGGRVVNADWTRSSEATAMLHQLRLARATIRGDRAAYEKATAALRSFFEAVAGFVLQVALTALLGPVAEAALGAELMEGVSTAARLAQWAEKATVGIAATIGSNAAVMGSSYSWAQFKHDLAGGLGGAIGATALEKLAGPVAMGLAAKLGTRCPPELIKMVGTVGSIEGAAAAEGRSLRDDLSLQNIMKTHLLGKVASAGEETIRAGLGVPVPKPRGATAGGDEERAPSEETRATGGQVTTGEGGARAAGGPDETGGAAETAPDTSEVPVSMHLPEAGETGSVAATGPTASERATGESGAGGSTRTATDTERAPATADESLAEEATPGPGGGGGAGRRPGETAVDVTPAGAEAGVAEGGPTLDTERGQRNRAEQELRARRFARDVFSLRASTRPDARARALAGAFEPIYAEWPRMSAADRRAAFETVINGQLAAAGLPHIPVIMGARPPGSAAFHPNEFRIEFSRQELERAQMSPEAFAALCDNAAHEARHALHHFRGVRAALDSGQFQETTNVPGDIVEAARQANDGERPAEPLTPDMPAYGEALDVYDQTHGARARERRVIINRRDRTKAAWQEARARARRLRRGTPERADADRARDAAYDAAYDAHNAYMSLAAETDAWRRGAATRAAVLERLGRPRSMARVTFDRGPIVEQLTSATEALRRARTAQRTAVEWLREARAAGADTADARTAVVDARRMRRAALDEMNALRRLLRSAEGRGNP